MVATKSDNSKTVARQDSLFSYDDQAALESFDQAAEVLAKAMAEGQVIPSSEELGDGFQLADKSTLVGVPMICLGIKFSVGDLGGYVSVRAITKDNRKIAFADGSTGLYSQLAEYTDAHNEAFPIYWKHGLRRSDYDAHMNKEGREVPAGTTYYLDTSA